MKRIFEIEWPDNLGVLWLNEDNLRLCLTSDLHTTDVNLVIKDVTETKDVYIRPFSFCFPEITVDATPAPSSEGGYQVTV